MTINELRKVHKQKKVEIRARLAEFSEVGSAASDERLFEELIFCIFTAAASAKMGLRSVEKIRPRLFRGTRRQLENSLVGAHRWPRARSGLVFDTREYLAGHCGLKLRDLLTDFECADSRRDFFAANPGIRGLGYKEASHFLRNIGFRGYAILDKHVLGRLAEFGVVENPKPPSTKKRYLAIEAKMKDFAGEIKIDFDELDLLLWFTKTGEILK